MNEEARDLLRLKHIISAINDIELIAASGIPDKKTYYSTIYLIQIIGEAANAISSTIKTANTHVSWREIVSMRNFIAHEYDKIDIDVVEGTVKNDIPILKTQITKIIVELQK